MPSGRPLTEDDGHKVAELLRAHGGNVSAVGRASGLSPAGIRKRIKGLRARGLLIEDKPFEVDALPDELPTAEELIAQRQKQFARKRDAHEARVLVTVRIQCDGPVGLALLGDPHVDDNGTDIALLQRHVAIINRTDGLFAGNIGDFSNNWVGRLARLYGQQSLSAAEAWVLVEWLVKAVDWCFLIGGNHDCWSGSGDPIKWMAKSARVQYEAHGMRLGLTLPTGRVIRLNARHDFSGRSQWNTAHGPAKAIQLGWRDHIAVCGHTHVSGHQVLRDPATGLISHALRVGSYKTFDSYADEKGLPNQTFMVAPVVVIRPQFADDDNRLITVCYDPETGADFLTFLRKRKSERAA
jgi:hypothetical protein